MIPKLINWMLVAVITLSPPGASLVRNHCDVSGATSVSLTLMNAFASDACCERDGRVAQSMAPLPRGCCSASVFSLAHSSATPDQPANEVPSSKTFRAPELPTFVSLATASSVRSSFASRTLPLLI